MQTYKISLVGAEKKQIAAAGDYVHIVSALNRVRVTAGSSLVELKQGQGTRLENPAGIWILENASGIGSTDVELVIGKGEFRDTALTVQVQDSRFDDVQRGAAFMAGRANVHAGAGEWKFLKFHLANPAGSGVLAAFDEIEIGSATTGCRVSVFIEPLNVADMNTAVSNNWIGGGGGTCRSPGLGGAVVSKCSLFPSFGQTGSKTWQSNGFEGIIFRGGGGSGYSVKKDLVRPFMLDPGYMATVMVEAGTPNEIEIWIGWTEVPL